MQTNQDQVKEGYWHGPRWRRWGPRFSVPRVVNSPIVWNTYPVSTYFPGVYAAVPTVENRTNLQSSSPMTMNNTMSILLIVGLIMLLIILYKLFTR